MSRISKHGHITDGSRCEKCYGQLPYDRRTWRPFWSLWAEVGGARLTFASDGPPLGYLIHFEDDPAGQWKAHWRAFAIDSAPHIGPGKWPEQIEVGRFKVRKHAMDAVERKVHAYLR